MLEYALNVAKVIGVCSGAVGSCVGGYVYLDGPIPASKHFVLAQYDGLKSRVIQSQIQTNALNESLLKQEQASRSADIVKETNPTVRGIYQKRLDEVGDELAKIRKDSESLHVEKGALTK